MGFFSSFFSGNPNVTVTGEDAAMAIATRADVTPVSYDIDTNSPGTVQVVGPQNEYGIAEVPGTSTWGSSLGATLGDYTTVRGNDGKINVPLTLLDNAAKAAFPPYAIVRGGMRAIDAIFGPNTLTPEEAAAEQARYTALAEARLSPSIPPDLLSQRQQDPAAQQALFGPTHIYGALPGQARRRGAYQYIPPTFGPRS
jgi:hypothetical protein